MTFPALACIQTLNEFSMMPAAVATPPNEFSMMPAAVATPPQQMPAAVATPPPQSSALLISSYSGILQERPFLPPSLKGHPMASYQAVQFYCIAHSSLAFLYCSFV